MTLSNFGPFLSPIQAETRSESVIVHEIKGAAYFAQEEGVWIPLKTKSVLKPGTFVKTAPESSAVLRWEKSGRVVKENGDSVLRLTKLNVYDTPLETMTETDIDLLRGSVGSSERRNPGMSRFKVNLVNGSVLLDGGEYHVEADGGLNIYRGAAALTLGGNQRKLVAGQAFSPASGNIVFERAPRIETLPAIVTVASIASSQPCENHASPTHGNHTHGNNGVGNGEDPQPPGNPPINDGPGTGPGNPGNNPHHISTTGPGTGPGSPGTQPHCPNPIHGNNGVGNGIDPQPPGNPPINDGPGTGPGNPGNRKLNN
ncbi:MAG: hypothetical protein ABI042_14950 [Verrucomicrobiota bacterium]